MSKTVFCFDLDGTVTSQEILPLISKEIGLHEEIDLLTQITLKGIIPFQTSFKLRVKLLAQIPVDKVKKIVAAVRLEKAISEFIRNHHDVCYVVTGNLDVWVADFIKDELGCGFFTSKAKTNTDTLELDSILDKKDAILDLRSKFDRIITIGDSMNDCSMFEAADVRIAFGGVHEPVQSLKKMSDYVVYDASSLVKLLKNFTNE